MLLTIEPKGGKGRSFTANCLSHASADALWVDADTKATRPIWATFAGPSEALRAFTENLRLGHIATDGQRSGTRMEFLRSVPYRWWTRALPAGGSLTVVAHPSLLSWRAPIEDAYRYRFAVIPARSWLDAQRFDLPAARSRLERLRASSLADGIARIHERTDWSGPDRNGRPVYRSEIIIEADRHEPLRDLLGYGALLVHYLDARLPLPIPRDPVFGAWLLLVGFYGAGPVWLTRWTHQTRHNAYRVVDAAESGCADGFAFGVTTGGPAYQLDVIAAWLAAEVKRWNDVAGGL